MSLLHQMVPVFFLIQFLVVLVAMLAVVLTADSEFTLVTRKPIPRVPAPSGASPTSITLANGPFRAFN